MKPPCSSRHARIAWAVTGPTSGRDSSRAWSAVLRFTSAAGAPGAPGAPAPLGTPAAAAPWPTSTCSPSTRTRARLSPDRSTPPRAPPAASMASTTREPTGSSSTPGRRTRPATSTTTTAPSSSPAAPVPPGVSPVGSEGRSTSDPVGPVSDAAGASGAASGTGSERTTHQLVTARPSATMTATTARWTSPSRRCVGGTGNRLGRRLACLPGIGTVRATGTGSTSPRGSGPIRSSSRERSWRTEGTSRTRVGPPQVPDPSQEDARVGPAAGSTGSVDRRDRMGRR